MVVNEKNTSNIILTQKNGILGWLSYSSKLSKTKPRVKMIRVFEDKDFVFAHMKYKFSSLKVAFEIFRFEHDFAVEHWGNMQLMQEPNASGRSMLDGTVMAEEHELTEFNRDKVLSFVNDVLINRKLDLLENYVCNDNFIQHSPLLVDGISALRLALSTKSKNDFKITYSNIHRILAEGNFVLSISERKLGGQHSAFYDLFRVAQGKIVEHWDTIESIPPRDEWKNDNGKF